MTKILVVCTANQNRSAMGEFILRHKLKEMGIHDVEVHSGGTNAVDGIGPPAKAIEVCKQHGIDISSHRSRVMTKEIIEESDLILVMESRHLRHILKTHPEAKDKVKLLTSYSEEYQGQDVDDPIGGSTFGFRTALSIINECIEGLVKNLPGRGAMAEEEYDIWS